MITEELRTKVREIVAEHNKEDTIMSSVYAAQLVKQALLSKDNITWAEHLEVFYCFIQATTEERRLPNDSGTCHWISCLMNTLLPLGTLQRVVRELYQGVCLRNLHPRACSPKTYPFNPSGSEYQEETFFGTANRNLYRLSALDAFESSLYHLCNVLRVVESSASGKQEKSRG